MRAIDIHVHPPTEPGSQTEEELRAQQAMSSYFRQTEERPKTPADLAEIFERQDIVACLLPVDSETITGKPYTGDAWVASIMNEFPERFIGFGSVDPHKGKSGVLQVEKAVKDLGLRGFKFFPNGQQFFANDKEYYPIWEKIQELGVPVITHSGHAGVGSGRPGGGGIKLRYSNPMWWDDVAADFPELNIILAHPAWPWLEEQISMLVHKSNVYMDISGWSPRYFPEALVREMHTRIQNKVLYGSDHPAIHVDRWWADWEEIAVNESITQKIFLDNAKRVLGIDDWPESK